MLRENKIDKVPLVAEQNQANLMHMSEEDP